MAAFLTGVAAAASVDYYACAPLRCSRLGGISGRPGYHRYSRPQHARRFPMPCALHKLPSNYLTLFPKPLTLGLVASTDLDDAAKLIVDAFLSIGGSSADTAKAASRPRRPTDVPLWLWPNDVKRDARQERRDLARKGLEWRLGPRLLQPSLELSMEATLLLVVQDEQRAAFAAAAELALRPIDGQPPNEFAVPPLFALHSSQELGAYLFNFVVASEYRRQGLGSRLLHACETIVVKEWNLEALYLHANIYDTAAMAFYRGAGFTPLPQYDMFGAPSAFASERKRPRRASRLPATPVLNRYHVKRLQKL